MGNKTVIKCLYILFCGTLMLTESPAWGEPVAEQAESETTVINYEPATHIFPDSSILGLIDFTSNVIQDPKNSLVPAMEKLLSLRSGGEGTLSILHIGDSHIQAGFWDQRFRELIQNDFGNAGRGLIVPYKLAKGNEPSDYYIRTGKPFETAKATSNGFKQPLSFTGTAVWQEEADVEFEIWSKSGFDAVTVFHHPRAPMLTAPDSLTPGSYCTGENTPSSTRIILSERTDTLAITGHCGEGFDTPLYYGFSLENGNPGVLYHAVGSNGAAFEHFMNNTDIADGGAALLEPDIIIVSLGTNNCYGRNYRSSHLKDVIERFITKMITSYPEAAIIMTTPRESCSRSGRQYRPNPNIADAGRIIVRLSEEYGIACWDLYSAAGGKGTSEKWFSRGLAYKDRIHFTEKGYAFLGDIMYSAFSSYYNRWLSGIANREDTDDTGTGGMEDAFLPDTGFTVQEANTAGTSSTERDTVYDSGDPGSRRYSYISRKTYTPFQNGNEKGGGK